LIRCGHFARDIPVVFDYASYLWHLATIHPFDIVESLNIELPEQGFTEKQLTVRKSLIQVYICAAWAKIFFSVDIMRPIELERHLRQNGAFLHLQEIMEDEEYITPSGHFMRRYKMKDHLMFRLYRPMDVAMELCEDVRPETLAYYAVDYLAGVVATYAGGTQRPVFLFHSCLNYVS